MKSAMVKQAGVSVSKSSPGRLTLISLESGASVFWSVGQKIGDSGF